MGSTGEGFKRNWMQSDLALLGKNRTVLAILLSILDTLGILCSSKSECRVADTKERTNGRSRSQRLRRFEKPMIRRLVRIA